MGELLGNLMGQLKQFQAFLWMSLTVAAVGICICLLLCRNVKISSRRMQFLILFFGMDRYMAMGFAAVYLKFMLVVSTLLCFRAFPLSHYIAAGLCSILFIGIILEKSKGLTAVILDLLLAVGMAVIQLLRGYIIEINADFSYVLLFVFMGICMAAYNVYAALTELQMLIEEKRTAYETTGYEEQEEEGEETSR